MELKNLEYLESIYRLRSFTKAAEEHYISQPSITTAIQKLERELGTDLIKRKSKPMEFTLEGEMFMEHVYTILNEIDAAYESLQKENDHNCQPLNLFMASMMGDSLLTRIFSEFVVAYPECDVRIFEGTFEQMLKQLEDETLDLAFTIFPTRYNQHSLDFVPLFRCKLCAVLPKKHPLAQEKSLTIKELENETLLVPREGTLIRTRISNAFRREQIVPHFRTVQQVRAQQRLIEEGYGIGFVTNDCDEKELKRHGIVNKPIEPAISFTKGFVLKREKVESQMMKNMISFVQSTVK